MARDYTSVHEYYHNLHDLQSSTQHYQNYDFLHGSNANAATAFELTVDAGECAGRSAHVPAQEPPSLLPQASHDRQEPHENSTNFSTESYNMSGCEKPLSTSRLAIPAVRKRKPSSYGTASTFDDDDDDSKFSRTDPEKKQNHSEIEKRRRDKMNTYITELSSMIPMCGAMARKLDKLTVLRMAVQHLRSVRGALAASPLSARPRPAFISERELNAIILQAAQDCFLLVVGCDRGRLLYVSASVKKMLCYERSELLGQSLFDILHPKDVAKVKEQLSSPDLSPRERLIDIKTMLPVKAEVTAGASRLCPGARRSFLCRIKCKASSETNDPSNVPVKEECEPSAKYRKKQSHEKKYRVVQCTGYLKSWPPVDIAEGGSSTAEGGDEGETRNMSCLVAVGRPLPCMSQKPPCETAPKPALPTRQLQYISRHAIDGKFLFVDQRVTLALGFLPQELLGTSVYEYVGGAELAAVARVHKDALLRREPVHTPPYSFRRKDGSIATIQTHFKPFKNPWTKDIECLVANNTTVPDELISQDQEASQSSFDVYKHDSMSSLAGNVSPSAPSDFSGVSEGDGEVQRLIDSQVESHKIGSAIAEEVLRRSSVEFSPDLPAELLQEAAFNQQAPFVDNILGIDMGYNQVRNNVSLSSASAGGSPQPSEYGEGGLPGATPPGSPPLPPLGVDGNGEAAMAVIMSLLEADAGLGGPVNFSGLPWPLP